MSPENEPPKVPTSPQPAAPQPSPAGVPEAKPKIRETSIWEVYFPRNVHEDSSAVLVASFPMIVYFWPSLLVFLACGVLQATGVSETALGWAATSSLVFNLLVIVTDLSQKKFVIATLAVVVVGLLLYIGNQKEMGFVASLGSWIAGLELTYSTHVYFVLTGFFWVFMAIGLMHPRLNYWRFEHNEFTHYIQPWGRDQSIPRQGSTVSREIPDVLELMLTFGGGSLVVRREGQVVARIRNVPFLGRRMIAIERMLGVTRVISD
ncbi:MAG: hypothetical protein P1V81_02295 [Planctomycetota bacterium]|nr:hypothetical protein [Planctomycetota bacterium]